jgi:YbgC/YbaW family acyl-CoA thioester hydrolase
MHFSNFFRFMETAEHAFLRSLGFSVALERTHPGLHLPRVHADCDYFVPLRFEDEVEIHLLVARKKSRSLTYQFRFCRLGGAAPAEVARGHVTVVCACSQPGGRMAATTFPPELAILLEETPADLLAHPPVRECVPPVPNQSPNPVK